MERSAVPTNSLEAFVLAVLLVHSTDFSNCKLAPGLAAQGQAEDRRSRVGYHVLVGLHRPSALGNKAFRMRMASSFSSSLQGVLTSPG